MKVNITIPTYNRANLLNRAIKSFLNQDYPDLTVTIIDDCSTDQTFNILEEYFDRPNLCYIKLNKNIGTAQAKNLGILISDYDAITFHDSDDYYHELKVTLQARALSGENGIRDPDSVWEADKLEKKDVVVCKHNFVRLDGKTYEVGSAISLVDDLFPNLQATTNVGGKFLLPNPALYSKRVFEKLGGFVNNVEEDRDMRNRTIAYGFEYCYIDQPLITKFEEYNSLTLDDQTGFTSDNRKNDRDGIKNNFREMMLTEDKEEFRKKFAQVIDIPGLDIGFVSAPEILKFNDKVPVSERTGKYLKEKLFKNYSIKKVL